MLLRSTTRDENKAAYFQSKLACSYVTQQDMKINEPIFKVSFLSYKL